MPAFPQVRLLVAFSGGVDSLALLGALAPLRERGLALRAVHINHGLRPAADGSARFCRRVARSLRVGLTVRRVVVGCRSGLSPEDAARRARYQALSTELGAGEVLLTAHHQDDQLETVLLQLLRGAGIRGLAAMPSSAGFAGSLLVRPLLSRTRAELTAWVRAAGLSWDEDETNTDERIDRNYLRRVILPLVQARWPAAAAAVSRSARHAAEAQRLLDALARADIERAAVGADLAVAPLRALSAERRRNALRYWIGAAGLPLPDARQLQELTGPVLLARVDAKPSISWSGARIRRHAGKLTLEAQPSHSAQATPAELTWHWTTEPTLQLPGGGTLELQRDAHGPVALDRLPVSLTVRWRRGGERIRLVAGGSRRSLKSLLQEAAITPELRARMPLLYDDERLLAAGSQWLDESVRAARPSRDCAGDVGGQPRGRLRWRA